MLLLEIRATSTSPNLKSGTTINNNFNYSEPKIRGMGATMGGMGATMGGMSATMGGMSTSMGGMGAMMGGMGAMMGGTGCGTGFVRPVTPFGQNGRNMNQNTPNMGLMGNGRCTPMDNNDTESNQGSDNADSSQAPAVVLTMLVNGNVHMMICVVWTH